MANMPIPAFDDEELKFTEPKKASNKDLAGIFAGDGHLDRNRERSLAQKVMDNNRLIQLWDENGEVYTIEAVINLVGAGRPIIFRIRKNNDA